MSILFYETPKSIVSGITLKDIQKEEAFNMALHCCQDEQAVLRNRQLLAKELNIPLSRFVFANQTHSDHFVKVTEDFAGRGTISLNDAIDHTDALYTFEKNIVLTTMTADCVPITFYSEQDGVIGAIHSGWKGTTKEITYKLFSHLVNEENVDLNNLFVHIGYSICQKMFEVDEDVANLFKQLPYAKDYIEWNEETGKFHIDNQLIVKAQCMLAGVPEHRISIDRKCTYLLDEGFSYRQNRSCGRHVTFIVQQEDGHHVEKLD